MTEYVRLTKELTFGREVRSFSYRELVVFFDTPRALQKVTPTLLISALPFANYVIFPLAYYFPRTFLCHHYYNLEQKIDYELQDHTKRLSYYKPTLRHLQYDLYKLKDPTLHGNFEKVLTKLGSGVHPSPDEILDIKTAFIDYPFGLRELRYTHLVCSMLFRN